MKYLTPQIYSETMIEDHLLSPFNKHNKIYYRYKVSFLLNGTAKIEFHPRGNNTQLVKGFALVDYATGRVISTDFGEYDDMMNFSLKLKMATMVYHCCHQNVNLMHVSSSWETILTQTI